MKRASYIDEEGFKWTVALPDELPESDAPIGVHIGPPPLDSLNLPPDIARRLNNQLFERGLLTFADVQARRLDVFGALQAALKVDVETIAGLYLQWEQEGIAITQPEDVKVQENGTGAIRRPHQRKRR